ncbi:MAG: sulfatase-like hydrolase/transferase [Planctomycetota bacterium]
MTLFPRRFACSSLAALALLVAHGHAQSNVLLILADDLGVDQVGCYAEGALPPMTPNIDGLVQDGVLFRNAWSCPSCSPTRATIMTGRYGFRTGIGFIVYAESSSEHALDPNEVTLPEMLDLGTNGAWDCGLFGKWHLGNLTVGGDAAPNVAGWPQFVGTPTNLLNGDNYFDWRRVTNGVAEQVSEYATTSSVDSAIGFIGQSTSPWLCCLSLHAPHSPFHAPPSHLHTVDLAGLAVSDDVNAHYRAMVEAVDTELGRLFSTLDPVVLANTWVIFAGDNGTPGAPALPPFAASRAKGTTFEGGINVPFIVAGPGVDQPGRESAALVHTVDLFKTIAGIAGVDLAATFPGREFDGDSLLPVLEDSTAVFARDYVYTERFAPNDSMGAPLAPAACPTPGLDVCQEDFGYAGPGNVSLTLCGDDLFGGAFVPLTVTSDLPSAPAFLVRSGVSMPVPLYGGTLAAFPPTHILPGATDANGSISLDYYAGTAPAVSFLQVAVLDMAQPQGVAFSNCVRAETLTTHIRAVRDERYKLVVNVNNCQEQLYDLLLDPFESLELLGIGALTPNALSHYRELSARLAQL